MREGCGNEMGQGRTYWGVRAMNVFHRVGLSMGDTWNKRGLESGSI